LDSAEVRYLKINFSELLQKLKEYAQFKGEAYHAKAIVLTGSLAKGNYTGASDADILVIADNPPTRVVDRSVLFAEPKLPVDLEPRVYTTGEFRNKVQTGDRFAIESLEIGIPLFGKEFFENLRKSLGRRGP
jgi:predicted nucleotidyltransferase